MAESLSDWIKSSKKLTQVPTAKMHQMMFFRDPIRPHIFDRNYFFAPVDGIILNQKIVAPTSPIEVKGNIYSIVDLFEGFNPPTSNCLIVQTFMTIYDVHIQRMPYGGMLKYQSLPTISTYNMPMLAVENDLLAKHLGEAFHHMSYEKDNARMIYTIYVPELDYTYYLILIADDEINTITPFSVIQNQWFHQNDRISFIRYGSQVDMILPLDKRFTFKSIVSTEYHVQGSVDKLIKIQYM